MKIINVIVSAILIKNVMHGLFIAIWYAFAKLLDNALSLLDDALTDYLTND